MSSWLWRLAAAGAAQVPTVLTLALLGGLAVWGARNDWRLSSSGGKPAGPKEEDRSETTKVITDPSPSSGTEAGSEAVPLVRIEFPSEEAVKATGIQAEKAEVRPMAQYVTANGALDYEPGRYAQLAPRAPGTIWKMYKVMGEAVHKGEVLAIIESVEVGKAKADLLQSLAQVDVRTRTLQRLQSAGASVAEGTLREAEEALRESRIRLFTDQQHLLNYGLALHIEDLAGLPEDQQVRHLRLLGLPEAIRTSADADTLTANLLPLTAPFEGLVARHPQGAPGEVVATTKPLFMIGDTSHLHIDLEVHLEDVVHLRLGQKVIFMPEDKTGQPGIGELAHISPEVNEKTRHVQVHAEVENPDGRLRPNTFGTGRILIREKPRTVAVPDQAVQWEIESTNTKKGRSFFVFVQMNPTTFQKRPVQLGLRDEGFTEVSGVEPGEMVVTTGSHVLKSELLKDKIGGSEE
jgi:cobalt-zinc-cadmium efflux system membrane fusion protein